MPSPPVHRKPVPVRPPFTSVHKHDTSDENQLHGAANDVATASGQNKGKEMKKASAFGMLPKEIIQQILFTVDPNTFDSLTLVNLRWHEASRSSRLYAHQLARCGVDYPANLTDDILPDLVRMFARSARRELFETVLNPSVTEVRLIYSASSSSAAAPGGEAFRFRFSPKGTTLLALSSSRIFVIDLSETIPVVRRELKVRKRPSAAAILDDASILAVLSSNHNVALYDLRNPKTKFIRSFPLENEPRTIALSPGAEVLGAAYDGGIEVYSLLEGSGPTDRRAVNCDTVDSLEFSLDGTVLIGTAMNSKSPTTVLVSAQHFSIDMPVEGLAQLWTTQVLFPRSSRDSSHASLLPAKDDDEEVAWTFAYDRVYQTFRAVRVEDLRNGHTYFTGPNNEEAGVIPPSTLPTSARDGSLVAAGFAGGRLWIYGVPERLDKPTTPLLDDTASTTTCSTPERTPSNASRVVVPQWQVLSERLRNVFVRGREISQIPGLLAMRFLHNRLIAVAGGGVYIYDEAEEHPVATGGGRIMIYDFSSCRRPNAQGSGPDTVVIEMGDGIQGPMETLQEVNQALETEIDIVRRRTVRRAAPPTQGAILRSRRSIEIRPPTLPGEDPYTHNAPRSATTLQRAATVARPIDPARYARVVGPDGRPLPLNHRENIIGPQSQEPWEPPPPPYTPRNENPIPLPTHLLRTFHPPPPTPMPQQPQEIPIQRARSTLGNFIRPWVAPIHAASPSAGAPTSPSNHTPDHRESAPLSEVTVTRPVLTVPLGVPSSSSTYISRSRTQVHRPYTMHMTEPDDIPSGRNLGPPIPRLPINRTPSQRGGTFGSPALSMTRSTLQPLPIVSMGHALQTRSQSLPLEHYAPVPRPHTVAQLPQQLTVPASPPALSILTPAQERGRSPGDRRVARGASVRRRNSRAERNNVVNSLDPRRRRGTIAVDSSSNRNSTEEKKKGICVVM